MTVVSRVKTRLANRQGWSHFRDSLRFALYVMTHPFDGFWDLTHEKRGSLGAANLFVLLTVLTQLLALQYTSFMFSAVYWDSVNIIERSLSMLVPLSIWCLANWGLTTLFDGKGTLRDVYMATAYALVPYVLIHMPLILVSNILTVQEGAIYSVFSGLSVLWTGLLLVSGMMKIHDYTLGKTLLFMLMSALGILIVVFLVLLFVSLVSDGVGYFVALYREIVFRLY